ncbi:hypothetical protein HYFRA_00002562 [Hymenoscyphus fraxineus]|uniref:Uncharacterized protein n=1 Tax=Hymenoscyphus fraxineus TaxID=746836 RepID=A0A9N9LBE0_9HELO|nr:hypothetical protein HYFRA_00002562 [Hymenoscyphus fraxineus]
MTGFNPSFANPVEPIARSVAAMISVGITQSVASQTDAWAARAYPSSMVSDGFERCRVRSTNQAVEEIQALSKTLPINFSRGASRNQGRFRRFQLLLIGRDKQGSTAMIVTNRSTYDIFADAGLMS